MTKPLLIVMLALVAVACSESKDPATNAGAGDEPAARLANAKAKTTRILVESFALQAFPLWAVDHDTPCPGGLAELAPLINKQPVDPFGEPLRMHCGDKAAAKGFGVSSSGPDRKHGTGDDIRSW